MLITPAMLHDTPVFLMPLLRAHAASRCCLRLFFIVYALALFCLMPEAFTLALQKRLTPEHERLPDASFRFCHSHYCHFRFADA